MSDKQRMISRINIFFFLTMLAITTSFTLKRESGGGVTIQFENFVGQDSLILDSVRYKNDLGQTFTVSKFRYYISNIHLKMKDGKEFISKEYFLIDHDDVSSLKLTLENIPEGEYDEINYILGVDSLRNCSGVQEGALDPAKGMFWAWNTGYVFFKLEGKSPDSKSPGNIFEFHVGGFREPNNAIRKITLKLEKESVVVDGAKNPVVKIKTDISEVFRSPVIIDFAKLSSVTDFHNATMMADNYSDMFSVESVESK